VLLLLLLLLLLVVLLLLLLLLLLLVLLLLLADQQWRQGHQPVHLKLTCLRSGPGTPTSPQQICAQLCHVTQTLNPAAVTDHHSQRQ